MGPEGKVKQDIAFYLSLLRKRGALDFWYNHTTGQFDNGRWRRRNSRYDRTGISDIVGVLKGGRALFIEVKSKTGKQSEAQLEFQLAVERFGALYILARSIADVQKALIPVVKDTLT